MRAIPPRLQSSYTDRPGRRDGQNKREAQKTRPEKGAGRARGREGRGAGKAARSKTVGGRAREREERGAKLKTEAKTMARRAREEMGEKKTACSKAGAVSKPPPGAARTTCSKR